MDDKKIVELYWERNESAVSETQEKYGKYLSKIAYNILADIEDSEESVNDTYLRAWNSIPPHKPVRLSAFLAKITRQISIDIYRKRTSKKRLGSEYALSLEELFDCAASDGNPEKEVDASLLSKAINDWLASVPEISRQAFICRYFHFDSVKDIAGYLEISQSNVKTLLYRARLDLKSYLEKEELL